jgi:hypothetical protein
MGRAMVDLNQGQGRILVKVPQKCLQTLSLPPKIANGQTTTRLSAFIKAYKASKAPLDGAAS